MYQIRVMQQEDCSHLSYLAEKIMPFAWSEKVFLSCLQKEYRNYVVLEKNKLIGFVIAKIELESCWIMNIGVDKLYQHQHIGQQLLQYVFESVQEVSSFWLEVRASNQVAIAFYKKQGFCQVGCRKGYYPKEGGREDALIMQKK